MRSLASKLNTLLISQPHRVVFLSSWLKKQGYSSQLLQQYKAHHWLRSIGYGAWVRKGQSPRLFGAVYALQHQAKQQIYLGGQTAFHYLSKKKTLPLRGSHKIDPIQLYVAKGTKVPRWFLHYPWPQELIHLTNGFLPPLMGFVTIRIDHLRIKISGVIRALMEMIFQAKTENEFLYCYDCLCLYPKLNAAQVHLHLEACQSKKVKAVFLYMGQKSEALWYDKLAKGTITEYTLAEDTLALDRTLTEDVLAVEKTVVIEKLMSGENQRYSKSPGIDISQYRLRIPFGLRHDDFL